MNDSNRKLTPEEAHKLATAPLPTFNIIPSKPYGTSRFNYNPQRKIIQIADDDFINSNNSNKNKMK